MARTKNKSNEEKAMEIYHKLGELKEDLTRLLVEVAKLQDEVMEIE